MTVPRTVNQYTRAIAAKGSPARKAILPWLLRPYRRLFTAIQGWSMYPTRVRLGKDAEGTRLEDFNARECSGINNGPPIARIQSCCRFALRAPTIHGCVASLARAVQLHQQSSTEAIQ